MRVYVSRISMVCLLALALFALAGCDSNSAKGGGVGVINAEKIFEDSQAGKDGVAYLNALSEEMQVELAALQKASQENPNKEEGELALQKGFVGLQQRFNAEQQQVMTKLNEHFMEGVETCRKQKNYAVILDMSSAVSYDEKADTTAEVIKIMDGKKISFTRLAPEGAETAPAPAAPATTPAPAANGTAPAPAANATAK